MNMINYIKFFLIVSVLILAWEMPGFSQSSNESLTITTYYPSPHGAYGELEIYDKTVFKDNGIVSPQDLALTTDGSGNLVLTVDTNFNPFDPGQLYFNDSGILHPFTYLQSYTSNGGATYCSPGYLAINFLQSNKIPANPASLPSTGFIVCLRGWE